MKTLYVTDLDGTLLNRQGRLSPYTIETMNAFIQEGTYITFATARSLTSVKLVAPEIQLQLPIIANNGTFLIDPNSGERVLSNFFGEEVIKRCITIFEKHKAQPLVYAYFQEEDAYKERISWIRGGESEGLSYYLENRKMDKRMRPLQVEEYANLFTGDIFYFTCIGSKESLQALYEEIKHMKEVNCIFHQELYRPEYWCEIMPKEATKANTMMKLKERYACDRVICFGDGTNDISMFEVADEAYAVENGVTKLKEIATGIIGSNEDDGVVRWLLNNYKKTRPYSDRV